MPSDGLVVVEDLLTRVKGADCHLPRAELETVVEISDSCSVSGVVVFDCGGAGNLTNHYKSSKILVGPVEVDGRVQRIDPSMEVHSNTAARVR